jgi:hypothetical protein
MPTCLCLIASTIYGNLLNTFAISTSLAAKSIVATRLDAKPARLVKPKAAAWFSALEEEFRRRLSLSA